MAGKSFVSIIIVLSLFLATASPTHAAIDTLNGQTGASQSFVNDSNIGITSNNDTHTLEWLGVLPVLRGGTGNSSFTNGSIPFIENGIFSENNTQLFWDNQNFRMGIRNNAPEAVLHIGLDSAGSIDLLLDDGGDLVMRKDPDSLSPGEFRFTDEFNQPYASFTILTDPNNPGLGSPLSITTGGSDPSGINLSDLNGNIMIGDGDFTKFGWPPKGTLQVVENTNSTLFIGNTPDPNHPSQKTGCIVMGDSDGVGVTYITANNGKLKADTVKPAICQ